MRSNAFSLSAEIKLWKFCVEVISAGSPSSRNISDTSDTKSGSSSRCNMRSGFSMRSVHIYGVLENEQYKCQHTNREGQMGIKNVFTSAAEGIPAIATDFGVRSGGFQFHFETPTIGD